MADAEPIITYHPIYLLGWWALNYGSTVQAQSYDGLVGDALEQAFLDDQDDDHHGDQGFAGTNISLEDIETFEIQYDGLDTQDPGEWPPGLEFNNPFEP